MKVNEKNQKKGDKGEQSGKAGDKKKADAKVSVKDVKSSKS